ncbi:MAG TPA: hypothetical protein VJP79_00270 [Nitrososphaera sp.]|nr:hypothetical protein [Nitrososphaera sp.]
MSSSSPQPDTSSGSSPPILTKKDRIAAIADEILSIDKNPGPTLAEILKRMSAAERSQVYWTCKKFLQDEYGLLIADSGHVGISDRYIPNLMFPGDIIVYAVVDMLKTGDCIQILQMTDVKDLSVEHAMVTKVSIIDGAVTVEDPLSGSTYTVAKQNVIGKVVKVITAFSEEWRNTFYEFKDRKWLNKTLKKSLELHKAARYSNQRQIVGEIERRLSKLKEEER